MPSRRLHVSRLVYWVIVAGVFSVAAWRRFALPLDPIADLDTWGYLSPALLKLTGGEFVHVHGRNFVYPAFLLAVLRLFGDFRAIVIVQHFLGLAGGGFMLMTWQRVRTFITSSRVGDLANPPLGLVLIAVYLIAGQPILPVIHICR